MEILQDSMTAWNDRVDKKDRLHENDVTDKENIHVSDRTQQPKVHSYFDSLNQIITVMPTPLQEAFDAKMGDFISRSRERQRYVLLRAEERTMQDFEASERQRLFGSSSNSRRSANTVADPSADQLFRPRKRSIGKREMKDLTKRHYNCLPEASVAAELKKKQDMLRSNRLRHKQYTMKVLNLLLARKR